jgi:hypothetical protein
MNLVNKRSSKSQLVQEVPYKLSLLNNHLFEASKLLTISLALMPSSV